MKFSEYILDQFFSSATLLGTPVFYLLVVIFLLKTNFPVAIKLIIALAVAEAACTTIKLLFPKDRPIPRPNKKFFEKYDASSFPSSHTARATTLAAMLNIFYRDNLLFFAGVSAVILVGYSRIYLKHHYLRDVIFGVAIGMLISLSIFAISLYL